MMLFSVLHGYRLSSGLAYFPEGRFDSNSNRSRWIRNRYIDSVSQAATLPLVEAAINV